MAGTLTPTPYQTVLDADGVAVSGALIYTYVGGTTTAATTYADASLATPNTNPIVADSAGRFVAYLPAGGNFKFTYKTAAGATIEEQDNILSVPGAAVNLDIEGTVGEAVTAGQVCYLSTGAEAIPLTAGLWYLTDADFAPTSTTCQSVGVAVSAIAINTAGTIRLAGTATMATAVVIGGTYYVSATAGAITATAPALSRTVGVALTTSTLLLAATTAVVTPAGSNTQVQFNDSGVLGGDAGFTYIKATDAVAIGGTLGVTGATTLSSTVATGALTITGAATYTTNLTSTTALATPAALTATQATAFASTVSGAAIMGFGTTNDVSLMNRAGTVVLGVGPNTTAVNMVGALSVGAITTSGAFSLTGGSSASFAVGGTSAVLLDNSSNYNVLSLNNSASLSTGVGLGGGASGDAASLYHLAASGGSHQFRVNGTDYMTLSSAGLLTVSGLGTHNFSAGGTNGNTLNVVNTTSGTANYAELAVIAGTTNFYVDSFSQGYSTSATAIASSARLLTDGSGGLSIAAAHASGVIRFYSGGTTERGRFTSGGILALGGTRTSAKVTIDSSITLVATGLDIQNTVASFGGSFIAFTNSSNAVAGSISHTSATVVAYNTTSDARLKRDLGFTHDLSGLRATQVHEFEWLTAEGGLGRGVFAQDAHRVMPSAVTVGTDEINAEGQLVRPWGVDYSKFVPELIVGWQQHDARLAAIEAKLLAAGV